VVTLSIVFRRPIGEALSRGIRRLRIGPVEAEFDHQIAEVRQELQQELRRSPKSATEKIADLDTVTSSNLNRLVYASPEAGHERIHTNRSAPSRVAGRSRCADLYCSGRPGIGPASQPSWADQ
jgi:hypothetical protein